MSEQRMYSASEVADLLAKVRFDHKSPLPLAGLASKYVNAGKLIVRHEWVLGGGSTTARLIDQQSGNIGPYISITNALSVLRKQEQKGKNKSEVVAHLSSAQLINRFEKRFNKQFPSKLLPMVDGLEGEMFKNAIKDHIPSCYVEALFLSNKRFREKFIQKFTPMGVPDGGDEAVLKEFERQCHFDEQPEELISVNNPSSSLFELL